MYYIAVLCVQGIQILSLLIFMPSLYSHSNLQNFYVYLCPLIFKLTIPNLLIILLQVSSNATSGKKLLRHRFLLALTYLHKLQVVPHVDEAVC